MTRRLWALVLAALVFGACGKKGPPVAPELRAPRPVSELTGVVRVDWIELAWANPHRRVDNTRLRDLPVARVYRVDDDGRGDPKPAVLAGGRVAGYTEVSRLDLAAPATGGAAPSPAFVDRQGLAYGRRYTYVIVTADSLGRVSPPARVSLTFVATPEPPSDLVAEAGEGLVHLRWEAVRWLVDGSIARESVAYEVLRAGDPAGPLEPVTQAPVAVTWLTDRGLENGRTYSYAVRAVQRPKGTLVRGEPSPRVAVTPVDTTPPSPPGDLVAAPSEDAVRLTWRASPEADVVGYVVYRAREGEDLVRVGSTRAPATAFVDRDVARGRYRYAVTAHDSSARANESARSDEVTVTVP
ncbi:MAG: fibronectin type III domain-containing protein [Candidatus Rokubacteria bacterium]|nr:fibronectin type III domain-containing protein [Candidatus Rokubacteria bacterium]